MLVSEASVTLSAMNFSWTFPNATEYNQVSVTGGIVENLYPEEILSF